MKLTKITSGEYKLETKVNGYSIRVEADYNECMRGFSVSYYVNNSLVSDDGFTGMTLRSIKVGLENDVLNSIEDYKKY
tara:strand:+ start:896 stop:1129 length:234 start_codon:yes stop_codon:yes gene_type:complete